MHTALVGSVKAGLSGLETTGQLAWRSKPAAIEFQTRLRNSLGQHLVLIGLSSTNMPHRISFMLHNTTDRTSNIFRLCVRGDHGNRRSDGRFWRPGTHLHVWSREHRDNHAVDPWEPWPPDPWREQSTVPLTGDEMRTVFEGFCAMLGIRCDVASFWSHPPTVASQAFLTLPDGEEVP
jgi:hypothetical protein